jgi:hypothetical protein
MELQEIRIASFIGLAVLWGAVLVIGTGLTALARALDHARDLVGATKDQPC